MSHQTYIHQKNPVNNYITVPEKINPPINDSGS